MSVARMKRNQLMRLFAALKRKVAAERKFSRKYVLYIMIHFDFSDLPKSSKDAQHRNYGNDRINKTRLVYSVRIQIRLIDLIIGIELYRVKLQSYYLYNRK